MLFFKMTFIVYTLNWSDEQNLHKYDDNVLFIGTDYDYNFNFCKNESRDD